MASMAMVNLATILFVGISVMVAKGLLTDGLKRCGHTLEKVDITKHCSQDMHVQSAFVIVPTSSVDNIIEGCLNCTLTLRTVADNQLTATIYTLGTEANSTTGECTNNRLDIYDGDSADENHLLSNKSGICGCNLAANPNVISTNNTMTLTFTTACGGQLQHGEFQIVIAAVKNAFFNHTDCRGFFECANGECIDKNHVCDGQYNCADHSDERGCNYKNSSRCFGMFECMNGQCIDKNLVCNGRDECPDHSDEVNCTQHNNGSCAGQFECANGQCINKKLVCNGKKDCCDGSDETGCSWTRHVTELILIVLVAVTGVCLLVLVIVLIVVCCRRCRGDNYVASTYRRLT